jgi:PKD repeat protein
MYEAWGYSILDISNPLNPTALKYDDLRLDPVSATTNPVRASGDGQSYIQTVGASPDGQRAVFSVSGPAEPTWHTLVGRTDGAEGFGVWGDFGNSRASGTVVQQIGSRYIAYATSSTLPVVAADVTTLPIANADFQSLNLASETTGFPPGSAPSMAGNYLVYLSGSGVQVVDASSPGSPGNITSGFRTLVVTGVPGDPFTRVPVNYAAAVDPLDATKLWVLVELAAGTGENSPSYGLVSITKDGSGNLQAPVPAGALFRVPSVAGETWGRSGNSASLVASNGQLFALMWATRVLPSQQFVLYSTSAFPWATPLASPVSASGFGLAATSASALAGNGTSVYQYLPTGPRAFVVPLTCQPVNAPAASSLGVTNASAGAPVPDGGTVFIGDQLTILPTVVPSPVAKPLSDWRFDFDFHAGNAVEDNGTLPRIRNLDNGQFGNPAAPPAQVTLVGPCDPQSGGAPASGAGCWNSVLTNSAAGGPDYAAGSQVPGSTTPLKIALEATNQYGSSNTAVFTVNWKVPAVRLASTQVLSGQPLVSASDGHPTATGFKWYFGATQTSLQPASGCTGPTCVPPGAFDSKGTYFYWLTATYANGFVTKDYDGTAATGSYTVTDFAPAFTVNGAASGPITALISSNVSVVNSSQRGATVTAAGGYYYSFCLSPCADNYVLWGAMGDAPPSGSPPTSALIQMPGVPGNYLFKIKVNYTGGTAYWPDPTGAGAFPITVTAATPKIRIYVNNQDPCPPGPFCIENRVNARVGDTLTAYSYVNGARDPGTVNLAWNFPNANQQFLNGQGAQFSYGAAGSYDLNVTRDGVPYSFPGAAVITVRTNPLNVSASASPNPAYDGNTVTFSCQVSGGSGSGYTYQWTNATGAVFSSSQNFYYNAVNKTGAPLSFAATCTVTDGAGASAPSTVNLTVNPSGGGNPGPPACTPVDFSIKDVASGGPIATQGVGAFVAYQVGVGQNLQFVPNAATYGSYSWTFGEGGNSAQTSPQYAYSAGGRFTATLTVTGNGTCTSASYTIFVTGPTGQFSAAYEDDSPITYANVTAFKNLVFTAYDQPSQVDAYSWDFGDGSPHATAPTVTHPFTPGAWTVKLTVTKGTASVSTTLALTVVPPPEPPKWVVPGMAYVSGQAPGTVWQSDVTLLNPHPSLTATYSIAFLDARNSVDDYSKLTWGAISVPPLGSVATTNLLGGTFGQPLGAYGALMVRGDVAPLPPVITARTFNNGDAEKGTFGLSVPQMSASGGVSTQASPAASVLIGLRENEAAYTNLGLVNLHNDWPTVELDFFDGLTSVPFGSMTVPMSPYQSLQINKALQDDRLVKAAGYAGTSNLYTVQVKILQGTAVYPYATVIDSGTTDAIVVTPTSTPSNAYRLPGVVRLTGANGELWRTRVTVSNPSSSARKVHMVFSYVACNANGCSGQLSAAGDIPFDPGQTKFADDFVNFWLTANFIPVSDATSYQNSFLDISPAVGDTNSDPLVVLGETYNATPKGHVGLQIPGYTPLDGASRTGAYKRLVMTGLASTTAYRTNLALLVVAGTTGKWVNVHVYSPQGTKLRDIPVFLDASGFAQVGNAALFGGLSGDLKRLSVVVDNLDDGVTVGGYATIIDNTSGDSTFVRAQPAP